MNVTPDVIGTIIAIFGAVATLFGGMYVLLHRLESRIDTRFEQAAVGVKAQFVRVDDLFDRVDGQFGKVDDRFSRFEASVDERFDRVDRKFELLHLEMQTMSSDIVDLKVSVARLEGPQPTLLRTR